MVRFLAALGMIAATVLSGPVAAQVYPEKGRTIRFVVSYPPGGANDVLARLIGQKLAERWGLPVVVENRPGANGMLGADNVARAQPDGYTIWLGTDGPAAINKSLYRKMPYDPQTAFAPVTLLAKYQLVLVTSPSLPVSSVSELIALAKTKPDAINYASVGIGSQHHLGMELFKNLTGVKLLHVPYKGAAAAVTALLSGEVQCMMQGTAVVQPYLKSALMKGLAVSAKTRSAVLPDLPTLSEAGVAGYDLNVWFGLLAPAGTPKPVVDTLHKEVAAIVALPEVKEKMLGLGLEPAINTPEEFKVFLRAEIGKWASIIKDAGLEPLE